MRASRAPFAVLAVLALAQGASDGEPAPSGDQVVVSIRALHDAQQRPPSPPVLRPGAPRAAPNRLPGPMGGEVVDGILVTGTPEFIAKTKEALDLLEKSRSFGDVRANIGVIAEGRCSGMWMYDEKPTYYVGARTWRSADAMWYAGTIAHDSRHSKLYRDEKLRLGGLEPAESVWTGGQAEKACLIFQLDVLNELGAPAPAREYLAKLIGPVTRTDKTPTYQNIGANKPDVCSERDW